VKIHSTVSSVKNVKVVFPLGVNVNLQRSTAHLAHQDPLAQLETLVNLVLLDLVVMMEHLELLLHHAQHKIPHASNVPLDPLAHPAPTDLLAHLAQMDNLEPPDNLLDKDLLDLPDLLEMLVHPETLALLDNLDPLETMVNAELVPLDQKDLLETLVPLVLLDQMATLVLPETMVLLDLLALPEILVLLETMVNLVLLVDLVFLAQMPPIVPAPLVQLSSSAVVLKFAKSALPDHFNLLFNETIKVVRTLFALALFSNKRKIKGF
jgi:hypothetical protein